MSSPGRPPSGLDEYREWQQRLEGFQSSGQPVEEFCIQEGVSRSTFYRWLKRLENGIPESVVSGEVAGDEGHSTLPKFLPISLKRAAVEIELPNGGLVRLPADVRPTVLVKVIRAVGLLRPVVRPP